MSEKGFEQSCRAIKKLQLDLTIRLKASETVCERNDS